VWEEGPAKVGLIEDQAHKANHGNAAEGNLQLQGRAGVSVQQGQRQHRTLLVGCICLSSATATTSSTAPQAEMTSAVLALIAQSQDTLVPQSCCAAVIAVWSYCSHLVHSAGRSTPCCVRLCYTQNIFSLAYYPSWYIQMHTAQPVLSDALHAWRQLLRRAPFGLI